MKYYRSNSCKIEFVLSENLKKNFGCHNHVSYHVAGLVLNGSVLIEKSQEQKRLSEGEIFIIPPYEPHAVALDEDAVLLSMCVGVSFIEKYDIAQAAELLSEQLERLMEKNILNERQAEMLSGVLLEIYSAHQRGKNDMSAEISTVSGIIVENPEREISLNELSARAYISKYYLIKKFRQSVGLTPRHFQIQARIRKAQKLLCDGGKIAETAAETGFYDQSHFCRYFNKVVGITPREYVSSVEELD